MTRRTQIPDDALVSDDGPPVDEVSGNDGASPGRWPALEAFRGIAMPVIAGATRAATAGGAVVRRWLWKGHTSSPDPISGMFGNGMAYLRLGAGPKTLLWIPGGPGNVLPTSGLSLRMGQSWSQPFVEQGYTVWWVTRRQNMPTGHSYADMAEDYARLIADEFDGKVDLVLGMSTGGEIGFHLAADHPQTFGHIVILAAGYQENERCKDLNLRCSPLLSQGQTSQAMALMVRDRYPRLPRPARWALAEFMGQSMYGTTHPYFANDVMVEAEAGVAFDARPILPNITVPVLLVCGDQDPYYPKEIYQETARLIPDCTLRMYEGKGHEVDKRLTDDVLDFVRQHPTAAPGHATQPPPAGDETGGDNRRHHGVQLTVTASPDSAASMPAPRCATGGFTHAQPRPGRYAE